MEKERSYAENLLFTIFNSLTVSKNNSNKELDTVNPVVESITDHANTSKDVITLENRNQSVVKKIDNGSSSKKENTVNKTVETITDNNTSKDVITLENRNQSIVKSSDRGLVCPVKVIPTKKEDTVNIKVRSKKDSIKTTNIDNVKSDNISVTNNNSSEEHRLSHFIEHLRSLNVNFNSLIRNSNTGLYELNIVQINGNQLRISADISGLLYSEEIKFFINPTINGNIIPINPGDENILKVIYMTKESMDAIINLRQIPVRYFITDSLFNLNKFLDLRTLKVNNYKDRAKVYELANNILSNDNVINEISKVYNGEKIRFAFCRYMSNTEFSIVCSRRNKVSSLSKEKLTVNKEMWINIKDGNYQITIKDCK